MLSRRRRYSSWTTDSSEHNDKFPRKSSDAFRVIDARSSTTETPGIDGILRSSQFSRFEPREFYEGPKFPRKTFGTSGFGEVGEEYRESLQIFSRETMRSSRNEKVPINCDEGAKFPRKSLGTSGVAEADDDSRKNSRVCYSELPTCSRDEKVTRESEETEKFPRGFIESYRPCSLAEKSCEDSRFCSSDTTSSCENEKVPRECIEDAKFPRETFVTGRFDEEDVEYRERSRDCFREPMRSCRIEKIPKDCDEEAKFPRKLFGARDHCSLVEEFRDDSWLRSSKAISSCENGKFPRKIDEEKFPRESSSTFDCFIHEKFLYGSRVHSSKLTSDSRNGKVPGKSDKGNFPKDFTETSECSPDGKFRQDSRIHFSETTSTLSGKVPSAEENFSKEFSDTSDHSHVGEFGQDSRIYISVSASSELSEKYPRQSTEEKFPREFCGACESSIDEKFHEDSRIHTNVSTISQLNEKDPRKDVEEKFPRTFSDTRDHSIDGKFYRDSRIHASVSTSSQLYEKDPRKGFELKIPRKFSDTCDHSIDGEFYQDSRIHSSQSTSSSLNEKVPRKEARTIESKDKDARIFETCTKRRRLSLRLVENSRRRRRKCSNTLDEPSYIYEESCQSTCHANCRTCDTSNSTISPDANYDCNADRKIYKKLRAVSIESRTSRNIFEASRRYREPRKVRDFVEQKSSRRRGVCARTKNRCLMIVGILIWTMLLTGIAARQSHHRTCPGCPHHQHTIDRKAGSMDHEVSETEDTEGAPSPDDLRLEAIKHQILTKLGLRSRPDVNRTVASVPRHLALETLYRAEAQPTGNFGDRESHGEGRSRDRNRQDDNEDDDDSSSYGKFYYEGEKYSYRNVDPVLDKETNGRNGKHGEDGTSDGEPLDRTNGRHRGHGDFGRDGDGAYRGNDEDPPTEMDDFYARTSEIITFAEPGRTLNSQPLLEFPRSTGDPASEPLRIKRATLWARVELRHAHNYQHHRRTQSNQRNITLWVFRVRCGNVTHLRGKELGEHLEMVTSLVVNVNQLGWQKFDVTRVVSNWYSGNDDTSTRHEKLTLLVDCTGCGSHVHVSTFGVQTPQVVEPSLNTKDGQDPDRPFLVVRTDPTAVKRVRRRAIECNGAIKGQCCKQRFYVSFSQLGWDDWIIAPQGYYANYCRGDCAAGHRTPDTFLNYYTHVIEEYRKMDRLAGMQPCCAPLKFSSMSLIYYGPDSNIIKRDLPKMVVDECGCP